MDVINSNQLVRYLKPIQNIFEAESSRAELLKYIIESNSNIEILGS